MAYAVWSCLVMRSRFLLALLLVTVAEARLAARRRPGQLLLLRPKATRDPGHARASKHHDKQEAHKAADPHGKAHWRRCVRQRCQRAYAGRRPEGQATAPVAVIPPPPEACRPPGDGYWRTATKVASVRGAEDRRYQHAQGARPTVPDRVGLQTLRRRSAAGGRAQYDVWRLTCVIPTASRAGFTR